MQQRRQVKDPFYMAAVMEFLELAGKGSRKKKFIFIGKEKKIHLM